jgi:hypothetical protein
LRSDDVFMTGSFYRRFAISDNQGGSAPSRLTVMAAAATP